MQDSNSPKRKQSIGRLSSHLDDGKSIKSNIKRKSNSEDMQPKKKKDKLEKNINNNEDKFPKKISVKSKLINSKKKEDTNIQIKKTNEKVDQLVHRKLDSKNKDYVKKDRSESKASISILSGDALASSSHNTIG